MHPVVLDGRLASLPIQPAQDLNSPIVCPVPLWSLRLGGGFPLSPGLHPVRQPPRGLKLLVSGPATALNRLIYGGRFRHVPVLPIVEGFFNLPLDWAEGCQSLCMRLRFHLLTDAFFTLPVSFAESLLEIVGPLLVAGQTAVPDRGFGAGTNPFQGVLDPGFDQ